MAFFMWLSFKFQLSEARMGHVNLALKDLVKVKFHPIQATNTQRQSMRCVQKVKIQRS